MSNPIFDEVWNRSANSTLHCQSDNCQLWLSLKCNQISLFILNLLPSGVLENMYFQSTRDIKQNKTKKNKKKKTKKKKQKKKNNKETLNKERVCVKYVCIRWNLWQESVMAAWSFELNSCLQLTVHQVSDCCPLGRLVWFSLCFTTILRTWSCMALSSQAYILGQGLFSERNSIISPILIGTNVIDFSYFKMGRPARNTQKMGCRRIYRKTEI